ncbi:DUF305 domain-containing protein [Candidatus Palauibacter sp.]|uniref:DUF305 domain-containing protein n=1 Tax=Candidatus Palauibacter sp. TaxID=3101350 RepID=UPI003B52FBDC
MRTQPRLLILILGLLASAQACASTGRGPSDDAVRPDAARAAELEALYRARAEAGLQGAHEADIRFMTHMIPHHAQALVMAGFAPANGASPSIQTLCARIINAQTDEIAIMSRWLSDRGLPVPREPMHMPGMLTPEQLAELESARGADFDRFFLEYMIQHHNGAVTMVRELFATDGAAQDDFVFKLASDIHVDQATEIARMELMLEALAAPEPGG